MAQSDSTKWRGGRNVKNQNVERSEHRNYLLGWSERRKFEKDQNVKSQIRLLMFWSFLTPYRMRGIKWDWAWIRSGRIRVLSWRLKFLSGTSFNLHVWRKIERTRIDLQVWATEEMMGRLPWGPPHCFLGAFLGSGGSIGVQSWWLGPQMKARSKEFCIQFFNTPNFQGSWSSIFGPWGSLGSNVPEMNV